jgi:hypothetical protein
MIGKLKAVGTIIAGREFPGATQIAREASLERVSEGEISMSIASARRQWMVEFITAAGLRAEINDVADMLSSQVRHNPGEDTFDYHEQGE